MAIIAIAMDKAGKTSVILVYQRFLYSWYAGCIHYLKISATKNGRIEEALKH
jgi:hypothetical protein